MSNISDTNVPRVLRTEHFERDKRVAMMAGSRTGEYRDWTEATVMTPFGIVRVKIDGFHADRKSYSLLIKMAMGKAWREFCNV